MSENGCVPAWMAAKGIKEKEWLNMTKAQLQTMQRPGNPLKAQVWATGMLHSSGYKSEIAMTTRSGGSQSRLTSNDIINELFQVAKRTFAAAGLQLNDEELAKAKETKDSIRRALAGIEEEGMGERRHANGTPLRDLPMAELKRLKASQIQLVFWLKPRLAKPETVQREWERLQTATECQESQVGTTGLPNPSISQILKIFRIVNLPSESLAKLRNPDIQKRLYQAWEVARDVFFQQVDFPRLLDVDAESIPQVGVRGGAFEKEREKESSEEVPQPVSLSEPVDRPTDPPSPEQAISELLISTLGEKLPGEFPTPELCGRINAKLRGAPLPLLVDRILQRKKAIRSMGMVESLANDVGKRWQQEEVARQQQEIERQNRTLRALKEMAENPNETQEAREYARAKLAEAS